MKNLAIFASGSGTNAIEIIRYFKIKKTAEVKFIITNNPEAGIINKAKSLGIATFLVNTNALNNSTTLLELLQHNEIHFIVLAGYLKLIPGLLIEAFPNAIVNIHPALLPQFGGKGMHGKKVHEAVLKSGNKESGISIHYVNEEYDEGQVIFSATCSVEPFDTAESLATRVLALEHLNYAPVIESLLLKN